MPNYTVGLTWPRSDGTQASWPSKDEQRASTVSNWFEHLSHPHDKYDLYEKKIGEHMAKVKGIAGSAFRMPLPPGYALFAHHKPQASGGDRVDVYLRGCPHIGKKQFRSPNEFVLHCEWLMDESKPIDDHSTCGCIYNNSSEAAAAKKGRKSEGAGATGTPVPKRPRESNAGPSSAGPSKKRKESPSEKEQEQEQQASPIVPERAVDMATGRRYRKGELIWFRIETIQPPADRPKNLPAITHWPGLIANAVDKRTLESTGGIPESISGVLNALTGSKSGVASTGPKKRPVVVFEYSIRPLGFFASSAEVIKRPEEIFPWQMGKSLLGGNAGWAALGKEGTRTMHERAKADLNELKGKGMPIPAEGPELDARWREKMAPRYAFNSMPKNWETVAFRLAIAIRIGTATASFWSQTDKIDLVPGVEINAEDREAMESQRKTLYQGLWWGGERVWVEDMVRIRRHRAALPPILGLPSTGAADRTITLRIRMITVEVSQDSTEEMASYDCHLYGDLFEIAVNTDGVEHNLNKTESDWVMANPKAPPGFYYKQLNEEGSEISIDLSELAGRIYPDILEPTAQTWFAHPSLPDEVNKQRAPGTDVAQALAGLLPSTICGSRSDTWKQDLFTIVSEATKKTEGEFKKHFSRMLHKAPEDPAANGTAPGGPGSEAGAGGSSSATAIEAASQGSAPAATDASSTVNGTQTAAPTTSASTIGDSAPSTEQAHGDPAPASASASGPTENATQENSSSNENASASNGSAPNASSLGSVSA